MHVKEGGEGRGYLYVANIKQTLAACSKSTQRVSLAFPVRISGSDLVYSCLWSVIQMFIVTQLRQQANGQNNLLSFYCDIMQTSQEPH